MCLVGWIPHTVAHAVLRGSMHMHRVRCAYSKLRHSSSELLWEHNVDIGRAQVVCSVWIHSRTHSRLAHSTWHEGLRLACFPRLTVPVPCIVGKNSCPGHVACRTRRLHPSDCLRWPRIATQAPRFALRVKLCTLRCVIDLSRCRDRSSSPPVLLALFRSFVALR